MKSYKYVDLSGYAFTGKHAVIDLLREFEGYHVPHYAFEFNLLRIQGGILDLENSLCLEWSPIRSDAAIRRFKKLVRRLGSKNSYLNPLSWFRAVGWNYDECYNKKFFRLSDEYVNKLVMNSWKSDWPYPLAEASDVELFIRKLARKIGFTEAYDFEVNLSYPDNFVETTKWYLNELLSSNVEEETKTIVMHNSFEPFQPERCLKFFDNAKCIIVDRDPRDNYVQQLTYPPIALKAPEFIKRYRLYRDAAKKHSVPHKDVLRIRFEDVVLKYDEYVKIILDHLEENGDVHIDRKKYFNPEFSRKNIGLWKLFPEQDEIKLIHRELKEFCYEDNH